MRLIVLSKTHAEATETRDPGQVRSTCALINISQTMMSSRSALKGPACAAPGPTLHSRCKTRIRRPTISGGAFNGKLYVPDRGLLAATAAGMVEPDGIEPTTSCLQSTRSTN